MLIESFISMNKFNNNVKKFTDLNIFFMFN
jgi:hypothetical protein